MSIDNELSKQEKRNLLIVLSGPTCCGKDTVMRELLKRRKNMVRLVTTNSRAKRADEKEGVDYYFISKDEFGDLIAKDAFFEWVEYRGDYRGTQKKHVKEALAAGRDVIWRIDVRGVKNIRRKVKKEIPNSVFIFLAITLDVLKQRMKERATEDDKKWGKWSADRAVWELKQYRDFDYVVHNKEGRLKETVLMAEKIIEAERKRVRG